MKDPVIKLIIYYLVVVLLILAASLLFSSCEVLKNKRSVQKDSVAVSRIDSGKVAISTKDSRDSLAWWREIISFLPQPTKDTIINNTTVPVNNYYPSQIIREGGIKTTETKLVNYDSLWNNKVDSLAAKLVSSEKSKETKVLTQWWVWVIMGFFGLTTILLLFGRYFTITKK